MQTVTPTTKVKDSNGHFIMLGKKYGSVFNAQRVQLLNYWLAVALTFIVPSIASTTNFLGLLKIFIYMFPQRVALSPSLSVRSACVMRWVKSSGIVFILLAVLLVHCFSVT